ncbi:hypothetical protein QQP08_021495 [Theobroma cacao]|nr:hypothetical protein QQP08_021495 [Theobroma cacao]
MGAARGAFLWYIKAEFKPAGRLHIGLLMDRIPRDREFEFKKKKKKEKKQKDQQKGEYKMPYVLVVHDECMASYLEICSI